MATSRRTLVKHVAVAYWSHQSAKPAERGAEGLLRCRRVVNGGRLGPGAAAEVEHLLDELDQVVDAVVVYRVFERSEQAEVAAEAHHVPRIDQGAALDAAAEQVFDLRQPLRDVRQVFAVERAVPVRELAIDLAQHPRRGDPHGLRLPQRRFGVAHPREELREVDVLQLRCAAAGQLLVQVLPGAREGLPHPIGFLA